MHLVFALTQNAILLILMLIIIVKTASFRLQLDLALFKNVKRVIGANNEKDGGIIDIKDFI